MSQKFNATIAHKRGVSLVKLAGIVDEDNRLGELVEQVAAGTVVIDLAEVDRINSCGVRDWVGWLGRIEAKPAKVVLVECSPSIVAQINLVSNFTGGGAVKSFYAPYFCAECDQEKVLLVDVADLGPPPVEPPTCRCDECDLVMDFDDMPDSYFAFLSTQKRVADSDALDGVLREFAAADLGEKSKIRSRGSQSQLSGSGGGTPAPPSVPSLQSIQRVATAAPARLDTPSPVALAASRGSAPKVAAMPATSPTAVAAAAARATPPPAASAAMSASASAAVTSERIREPARSSSGLVIALVAALLVSTALLIYLLAT